MEYIESLLEEYYELSESLLALGGPNKDSELYEEILSIEEEICWECSLPASIKNRQLFQFYKQSESRETNIQNALQSLERARSKYFYKPEKTFSQYLEMEANRDLKNIRVPTVNGTFYEFLYPV
ncbi:hypothetical protein ND861_13100 [Leptospira sp. 2 VSF19]|uniref:Uncharacterized protein n=1 Tax=Leptospira soteropolitanensis TaxID=2950025 RepID=A0AAW5VJ53_9LEPT|nr:hypothetical protein [Leptospira soteropolitanensis]MCW7493580.1 hypothetical protein [Leptospira soteropolitanensis]MCW7501179.1 hypothetical protein [Leptospira soteropolitanensis]MCW7523635.1 hypothetical protein [Leptospira soteropolitanensis]MCW7527292.1 hypothetical protein [Leptospira soteropolitanensis]MCW7531149.1 hypothetical protein [Leptospira soteropolitanensis]